MTVHRHRDVHGRVELVGPAIRDAVTDLGLDAPAVVTFEPQGETVHLTTADAVIVVHTWPEYDRATIDVYAPDGAHAEAIAARIVRVLGTG